MPTTRTKKPLRSSTARGSAPKKRSVSARVKKAVRRPQTTPLKAPPLTHIEELPLVVFRYRYSSADDHGFTYISANAKKLLGAKPAELLKSTNAMRLHPDDVEKFKDRVRKKIANGDPVDVQLRILHRSSITKWIHITAVKQHSAKGTNHYTGLMMDVDARRRKYIEQSAVLDRMEEAQDIAKMGWYDFNVKSRVLDLTSDFAESLGLPIAPGGRASGAAADKYIETFLNALHPDDRERYLGIIADESWRRIEFDYRILTRSNEIRHLCSRIQRTADKSGKRIRDFAVILDITERKRLEEDLRAQAGTDPLTNIPNRRSLEAAARREVERARRYAKPFAVIVLDIDFFKRVNDNHGHDIGDIVLKEMTKVCLTQLRLTDVLARLGGEEFAVLLPETDIIAATKLAERLRVAVETKPITTPKGGLPITVSLGVAQFAPNESGIDSALKRADEALYEAKRTGRNKVLVAKLPSLVRSNTG